MHRVFGDPDALVAFVHRDVRQRALGLEAEATRDAEARVAQAEADARAEAKRRLEAAEREARDLRQRRLARADNEGRRRVLAAREELLDAAYAGAESRLRALTGSPEYDSVLRRLASLAGRALGSDGPWEVAADPLGHARLPAQWSDGTLEFRRAPDPVPDWGGLIARGGRLEHDATFANRLALAREQREAVHARLMGEP